MEELNNYPRKIENKYRNKIKRLAFDSSCFTVLILLLTSASTSAQDSSPTPVQPPRPPWEVFKDVYKDVSLGDVAWVGVTLVLVALLYKIAINERRRNDADWTTVVKWIAGIGGWSLLMIVFGWFRISANNWSVIALVTTSLFSLIAVLLLREENDNWQKILSGIICIVIGISIVAAIAVGAKPLGYAVSFGLLLGILLGMLIISIIRMRKSASPEKGAGSKRGREEGHHKKKIFW